jgi:hypothetical protein
MAQAVVLNGFFSFAYFLIKSTSRLPDLSRLTLNNLVNNFHSGRDKPRKSLIQKANMQSA